MNRAWRLSVVPIRGENAYGFDGEVVAARDVATPFRLAGSPLAPTPTRFPAKPGLRIPW